MSMVRVLGTANSVFGLLQLDYCGAASHCLELYTLCTYLAARLCTIILRFVDGLFGAGVPDDRSVFKCWHNKRLITA